MDYRLSWVPSWHEYKLMGLSPYADQNIVDDWLISHAMYSISIL